MRRITKNKKSMNKKGISIMVGYILLVVFAVIISVIVFQWIVTFIPRQALECPEGTSLFIREAYFDQSNSKLILKIRNNGKFNVTGYFIHGTDEPGDKLPTIPLWEYIESGGQGVGGSVLFQGELEPGAPEVSHVFNTGDIGHIYKISIIPTRWQEVDGRREFVSCGNAMVEHKVDLA